MKHLRLFPLVLVLLCFCMPWIDIRCDHQKFGHIVVTQSGLEMTYGGATIKMERPVPEDEGRRLLGYGFEQPVYPIIAFGLLTFAALATYPVVSSRGRPRKVSLRFGFAAAACLIYQLAAGFPLLNGIGTPGGAKVKYTAWLWITLCSSVAYPLLLLGEASESSNQKKVGHFGVDFDPVANLKSFPCAILLLFFVLIAIFATVVLPILEVFLRK